MPTVLAVVSDLHCGSTVALCPPQIELDDGGKYVASRFQAWIWGLWNAYWDEVERVRDEVGGELYALFNGDMTDGDHHGTTQILSGNPTAQAAVVDACMKVPLALKPDRMFFVRGTEAHVGKSASHEERIAKGLHKDGRPVEGDPDTGTASWWHLRMQVEGVRIDAAHHGRAGFRPWTERNASVLLAKEIFHRHAEEDARHGREPSFPHLALRSHYHRYSDSHDAAPTRVLQTAAWQLATAFVHRIGPETVADVGGHIVVVDDGKYEVRNIIQQPSRGAVWTR